MRTVNRLFSRAGSRLDRSGGAREGQGVLARVTRYKLPARWNIFPAMTMSDRAENVVSIFSQCHRSNQRRFLGEIKEIFLVIAIYPIKRDMQGDRVARDVFVISSNYVWRINTRIITWEKKDLKSCISCVCSLCTGYMNANCIITWEKKNFVYLVTGQFKRCFILVPWIIIKYYE